MSEELIRALGRVVRGEDKWESLRQQGVRIDYENGEWSISPLQSDPVPISIEDIAAGFITLFGKDEAIEWASFLLAASPLIDLEPLQDMPHGEVLLNGLWDLSFDRNIEKDVVEIAQKIVSGR